MLDREVYSTEEFKKQSKYYVFCKINADEQTDVKKAFGVTGLPTIKYLKGDAVIDEQVGYSPKDQFIAKMNEVRARAGM